MSQKKFIPLLKPSTSQKEIRAVTKTLNSGWWGLGPVTQKLEAEFAAAVGAKYAVALNSATSALHLAVRLLKGKKTKGNLITTPLTFVSTAAVGLYEGLEVRFADIDPDTLCLDREQALSLADKHTIAIIPVHYAGAVADTDYPGYSVIEDAAHAAGSPRAGRSGNISVWSFHPVKNIATGDAGMLTTNQEPYAKKARTLRWMGIDQDTWARESKGYNWEYSIRELGFKYHSNDIMSAIALAQLQRLTSLNRARRRIAKRYLKELADLPLTLPHESDTWHLFVLRVSSKLRNPFIDYLRDHYISVGVHYKPLHLYPIFNWKKPLPVTDRVWSQLVDIPIFPDLTHDQQTYIIQTIKNFFKKEAGY